MPGGFLSAFDVEALAALPLFDLINRNRLVDWEAVSHITLGCENSRGEAENNIARTAALRAGFSKTIRGEVQSRRSRSGLFAVVSAAKSIASGELNLIVTGGVESVGQLHIPKSIFQSARGNNLLVRANKVANEHSSNAWVSGVARLEYLASHFSISRDDQDQFSFRSQARWHAAADKGFFEREAMVVRVVDGQGNNLIFRNDEARYVADGIAEFRSVNEIHGVDGTITLGNSSPISDGACAMLLASESAATRYGLVPRVRIVAHAFIESQSIDYLLGSSAAVHKVLKIAGLKLSQIDFIEISEASAVNAIAVLRELKIPVDADYVNTNGGSLAVGDPAGATGARLVITAINQLESSGGRFAVCAICDEHGQGVAILIERIE
ncbi:beta-ketoadipyl CoA thiolase [gamma proteobacterium BDW918]|nr:beta-ketoadipyl CoA thiolase [gamma proteobacterium BDW918]